MLFSSELDLGIVDSKSNTNGTDLDKNFSQQKITTIHDVLEEGAPYSVSQYQGTHCMIA